MSKATIFLLLGFLVCVQGKGVNKYCTFYNKALNKYSVGDHEYPNSNQAKNECSKRNDCFGITREAPGKYTLRQGSVLNAVDTTGYASYVPCAGYFGCTDFGLKSVHGKFLTAKDGKVRWNRGSYGNNEKMMFEQWGRDSGYIKSVSKNKYLSAPKKSKLSWGREKNEFMLFTVFQSVDQVAFKSIHGTFLSAQSDGTVDVDRTSSRSWEWFTVDPTNCLNNIDCDCSKDINEDDYELQNLVYDTGSGEIKAFAPDRVGYQHLDNRFSSITQSTKFSVSEQVTESASFTHTAGTSVKVGTSFKTGVPFVAEGKVSVDVTASYQFSSGTTRSETKKMEAQYNCVAPAGSSVTCEALLFKYRVVVSYTQTWKHKTYGCTCESKGEFSEISANEMRLVITEDSD